MMDDFAGDNMDIALDKNILMEKKNDLEMEGGEVVDFLEAMGSTFPGDDFLNSFIDLSNFADIQVMYDYTFLLLFRWGWRERGWSVTYCSGLHFGHVFYLVFSVKSGYRQIKYISKCQTSLIYDDE